MLMIERFSSTTRTKIYNQLKYQWMKDENGKVLGHLEPQEQNKGCYIFYTLLNTAEGMKTIYPRDIPQYFVLMMQNKPPVIHTPVFQSHKYSFLSQSSFKIQVKWAHSVFLYMPENMTGW